MIEMDNCAEKNLRIRNINEERVLRTVEEYLDTGDATCGCPECALDILALSLNATPARYVVNEYLMDLHHSREGALSMEIVRETVERAAQQVAMSPRCGGAIAAA